MRFDLKPGDTYNGVQIVAVHHDGIKSVFLGREVRKGPNGQTQTKYVIGFVDDQTYKFHEWSNGHYTDKRDKAIEVYRSRITVPIPVQ